MKYGMYYQKDVIGDILLIEFSETIIPNKIQKSGDIIALFNNDTLVGYNFLNISKYIKIKANGLIPICPHSVTDVLNYMLKNASFNELDYLDESGFKVVTIKEVEEHPDSNHLHILRVSDGNREYSIVCGSYNVAVGLKVVLATDNTFMPNGKIIKSGEVLGVYSEGMLCSGKELNIPEYENKRGLYILEDSYKLGDDFYK